MDNDNLNQTPEQNHIQTTSQDTAVNPAPTTNPAPAPAKKLPILTIALAIIAAATVGFAVFEYIQIADLEQKVESQKTPKPTAEAPAQSSNNYRIEAYDNRDYYIITGDYSDEYDLQFVDQIERRGDTQSDSISSRFNKSRIMTLDEYSDFCKTWGFEQKYSDPDKTYAVLSYVAGGATNLEVRLADVETDGSAVKFYVWDDRSGSDGEMSYLLVVPVGSSAKTLDVTSLITEAEFENIKNRPNSTHSSSYENMRRLINNTTESAKPIIYLYPEQETKVSVSLGYPELLTTVYPEYSNGWNVIARPDGTLTDLRTGRNLYALYWEGKALEKPVLNEGFVVAGKDSVKFLEEKLATLGLSDREAEEFIVYWLPKLESSPYNLIRFETKDEIEANMPLAVSPKPDTTIRVMMDFLPLETPINIPEQSLPETSERNGFTVVEWGGSDMGRGGAKLE